MCFVAPATRKVVVKDLTESVFAFIHIVEEWVLSIAMLSIAGLTIANVLSRSVLGESLAFTEELSQFLIILVCFVGLSYAASKGRHIRMNAFLEQLPHRPRKAMMIAIAATTSLLMFYLAYQAMIYVRVVFVLESVSPVLQVPLYIVYMAAPIGLVLAGIQYILTVIRNVTGPEVYLSYTQSDTYKEPAVEESSKRI